MGNATENFKAVCSACSLCGSPLEAESPDASTVAACDHCGLGHWFRLANEGKSQVIHPSRAILRSDDVDQLTRIGTERPGWRLVLDLEDVHYMSSTVLGKLITLQRQLKGNGHGNLVLENLNSDILEVFQITKLDQVFQIL